MKYLVITGLILLTVATFAAGAGYIWCQQQLGAPVAGSNEPVYVEIPLGMSSAEIADMLEEKGLIRNSTAFRLYARLQKLSGDIKAGIYLVSADRSVPEILTQITEGDMAQKVIRIPGGVILDDIVTIMVENGFPRVEVDKALSANYDFTVLRHKPRQATLEGYLFPDTYHIGVDATAEEFIAMAIANSELKIDEELRGQWRQKGLNLHEGLTLASIVQKEAAEPAEQLKVAQVFLARLERNQRLEADPTYLYGAKISGRRGSPELDSPYNTYRHHGLPPGPISTVEENALRAVANPADTNYLFFVTGEDGVTRFSRNKQQHLEYIDRFGISR